LRKVLPQLAVSAPHRAQLVVDDEARRAGRALVDRQQHGGSQHAAPGSRCRLNRPMRPVRAVAFDFNGTLSDDEPVLLAVYQERFAEHGRPLTAEDYYGALAGLSEEVIIGTWLDVGGATLEELVEQRIDRYLARCRDGETISLAVRDAVAEAAARVPVAVVSGAVR